MAYEKTAASLVEAVRDLTFQPVAGGPSTAELLRALNREQVKYVVPVLMGIGDEFFVTIADTQMEESVSSYAVPSDSIASKVRYVQSSIDDGTSWTNLTHSEPERAPQYTNSQTTGQPAAYYLRGNNIVVLPAPSSTYLLRIAYYARPRQIVEAGTASTACSGVTGPSGGNYTATVGDTTPMDASTTLFDLVDASTFEVLVSALPGSVSNGTTILLTEAGMTSDQITALLADAVGNVFIASGTTPIADLPVEACELLTQRTAAVMLSAQNDPRAPEATRECDRIRTTMTKLFAPRSSGMPRKIVNRHGPGWGSRSFGIWIGYGS